MAKKRSSGCFLFVLLLCAAPLFCCLIPPLTMQVTSPPATPIPADNPAPQTTVSQQKNSTNQKPVPSVKPRKHNLHIEHLNTKQVNGKWRYFFQITNKDDVPFSGTVTISLKRADGGTTWFEKFDTKKGGMVPGGSNTVFTDAHTGPTDDYGEFKITKFSYEWK